MDGGADGLHDPTADIVGADEAMDELVGHEEAPLFETFATADKALDRLKAGNKRFARATSAAAGQLRRGAPAVRAEQLKIERDYLRFIARGSNPATRMGLEASQAPYAAVITCSDSRVAPSLLFDAGLGSLFVIRNAGGVTDDMTLASVEYAVNNLGVKLVVVMGHESCGAVTAAVQAVQREDAEAVTGVGTTHTPAVGGATLAVHSSSSVASTGTNALMKALRPAARAAVRASAHTPGHGTAKDVVARAVRMSTDVQALKLVSGSASLQEAVANRRVKIVAGLYHLRSGTVSWVDTPVGATAATVRSGVAVRALAERPDSATGHFGDSAAAHRDPSAAPLHAAYSSEGDVMAASPVESSLAPRLSS